MTQGWPQEVQCGNLERYVAQKGFSGKAAKDEKEMRRPARNEERGLKGKDENKTDKNEAVSLEWKRELLFGLMRIFGLSESGNLPTM